MNVLLIAVVGLIGTLAWLALVYVILKRREYSRRQRYRHLIASKMEDLRQLQQELGETSQETKIREIQFTFIFEKNLMEVKL